MKNKLYFLAFSAILFSLSACDFNCIEGSGNQVTKDRNVEAFSKVDFGGSIKMKIRQDSSYSMRITADDNIQKEILTRVKGDVLEIKMKGNFCNTGEIIIELGSKKWNGIDASGSTQIISENQINTDDFMLDLSGSSKVDLDIVTGNLKTSSSGASKINLKGQARQHDVDLSGSAEINAYDFVVSDYRIESSGASNCNINVLNSLKVNSSGASKILYKGNPKDIANEKSGASTLKHVE
ncbi:MAG: head GIN domain-containing protein [Pelobium sp.]